ncbi:hypothetical protein [Streptomyces sp. MH13]|uniref:hypothetical protein n=1 Tax=Streptomyces sp. MH13 TaxID=3417651 RepID=UPI003CE7180B
MASAACPSSARPVGARRVGADAPARAVRLRDEPVLVLRQGWWISRSAIASVHHGHVVRVDHRGVVERGRPAGGTAIRRPWPSAADP